MSASSTLSVDKNIRHRPNTPTGLAVVTAVRTCGFCGHECNKHGELGILNILMVLECVCTRSRALERSVSRRSRRGGWRLVSLSGRVNRCTPRLEYAGLTLSCSTSTIIHRRHFLIFLVNLAQVQAVGRRKKRGKKKRPNSPLAPLTPNMLLLAFAMLLILSWSNWAISILMRDNSTVTVT